MPAEVVGELTCSVHLAATVKGLMQDGGAVFTVREIQRGIQFPTYYCTCRLAAEFHVSNVGRVDADEPFPLFRQL